MKGIVLAGGTGSRLAPLTNLFSKQLLPVYDKPMIYYAIMPLMLAGIRDILLITTPNDQLFFEKLLRDGSQLGVNFSYVTQPSPDGLAQAFILAEDFIGSDTVCLVLGDNIFHGSGLGPQLSECTKLVEGSYIFVYEVSDPERYGIVTFNDKGGILDITEKPNQPRSNYAVTGIYFYDNQVIDIAKRLKPSARGELEITDVNKAYLAMGKLQAKIFGRGIAWLDTGTHESLLQAAQYVQIIEQCQGLKIACLEEIAWNKGYIDSEQLELLAIEQKKSSYGEYLFKLLK